MKQYKILTAAVAAAVLGGASAMAQFNYQNGDLLAAFGNAGAAGGGVTDVIVNLGPISNFQQGTPYSVNLSSVLNSAFGGVSSGVYWAVFGINDTTQTHNTSVVQASPYTVWASLPRSNAALQNDTPGVSGNANSQHLTLNQINTIISLTSPAAAGAGLIQDYAPNIETVATSLGGFSSLDADPYNGNLGGTWAYNLLNSGSGTSDFYQSDPGNTILNSQAYLGNFSLDPSGNLTFNPVPEPATSAMIGAGALALVALRRRQQA